MPEAFLQRQLTHPPFPHACRVGMAQCMWCDPRFPDTKPLAVAFKQLDQGMIAERLKASLALTSHQKHQELSASRGRSCMTYTLTACRASGSCRSTTRSRRDLVRTPFG